MFTGIIEETGEIISLKEGEESWRLELAVSGILDDLKLGDSVAVNGCCLTAVTINDGQIGFDVVNETVKRTSVQILSQGDVVNLERALLPATRMGGHFVTGHVDGVGRIESLECREKDYKLRICPDVDYLKYIVSKGSIAVEGISLTVASVDAVAFEICLIPYSLEMTNLKSKKEGDLVNLEFDLIAKYVEKLTVK